MAKIVWLSFTALMCFIADLQWVMASEESQLRTNKDKLEYYQSDNITNQIPYFDNRFRIDAEVEEIILIFYRKSGTQPVILVQPDGSKIRVNNYDKEKVEWYDDRTYDMIKMKSPMVGPWQAIGQILPNSKILIVSDVRIVVDPLPEVMLSGETIKITGSLMNGEHPLKDPEFNDVVNLDVDFYSTNNSEYDNFGAVPVKLTTFRDDGQGLDEYENDSVFTGEFTLDFAPGEWQPIYIVKMPMMTRELKQVPIRLRATPVTIDVQMSDDEMKDHELTFIIDGTYVDVDSLLFQGKTTYPDRQDIPFSIMTGRGDTRTVKLEYTEPGIHRINTNVFGKTINGREFRLVLPEYAFNVERKEVLLPDLSEEGVESIDFMTVEEREAAFALKLEEEKQIRLAKEEEEQFNLLMIVLISNLFIITVAGLIYFVRKRKAAK